MIGSVKGVRAVGRQGVRRWFGFVQYPVLPWLEAQAGVSKNGKDKGKGERW